MASVMCVFRDSCVEFWFIALLIVKEVESSRVKIKFLNYFFYHKEPAAPQVTPMTTSTGPTHVTISWTQSDPISLEQYHLFYHQHGKVDAIVDLGFVPKETTSYSFDGLQPSTEYVFYIEAVMSSGTTRTTNSASYTATTGRCKYTVGFGKETTGQPR